MSFTSWLRKLRTAGTPVQVERHRRRASRSLAVECLEDRLCLALDFGWARAVGATDGDMYGNDVAIDSASNVYVTGQLTETVVKYSPAGTLLWAKQVGLKGDSIVTDTSGNVFVSGIFEGQVVFGAGESNQTALTAAGDDDIFVAKLDSLTGNLIWVQQFGGTGSDAPNQLAMDKAGNPYLTGTFTGDVAFGQSTLSSLFYLFPNYYGSGVKDGDRLTIADGIHSATTFEYDNNNSVSAGDIPIAFTAGFDRTATAQAINNANASGLTNARADTNVYISRAVSVVYSPLDSSPPAALGIRRNNSAFVAKLASNTGDVPWANNNWGPQVGYENASGLAVNDTGVYTAAAGSYGRSFITKFAIDGSGPQWTESLQGADANSGGTVQALGLDSLGNLFAAGAFGGTVDFDPGSATSYLTSQQSKNARSDAFVWKLDSDGKFIWADAFGSKTNQETVCDLAVDAAGSVYTTCYFYGTVDFDPGSRTYNLASAGEQDVYVSKLDGTGKFVWAGSMGGRSDENGAGITVDFKSNVYVTGGFRETVDFDPTKKVSTLTSTGYEDLFVVKLTQPAALQAAVGSAARASEAAALTSLQMQPLLAEAVARWQATGIDTAALHGIDIRIADLGGAALGQASGNTIWLDRNAAGWGWFIDSTPQSDTEFTTPGNQGEQNHMDALTVVMHELGHLLSYEHAATGVMSAMLATGIRQTPGQAATDWLFAQPAAEVNDWLSAATTTDAHRQAH